MWGTRRYLTADKGDATCTRNSGSSGKGHVTTVGGWGWGSHEFLYLVATCIHPSHALTTPKSLSSAVGFATKWRLCCAIFGATRKDLCMSSIRFGLLRFNISATARVIASCLASVSFFRSSFFLSLCLSVCLSLSLSHAPLTGHMIFEVFLLKKYRIFSYHALIIKGTQNAFYGGPEQPQKLIPRKDTPNCMCLSFRNCE